MEKKIDIQHTNLAVANLRESETNPRRHFDRTHIAELAASVREKGVLSPILVRPHNAATGYEIIAGACRYRAAVAAGLAEVPCIIRRDLSDRDVVEIQIIENCQRKDLHPLEEAAGYQILHQRHGLAVEDLAARVGKSRGYVYGRMKLAELPEDAKLLFLAGKLDAEQALLVARIDNPQLAEKAAREIARLDLTVRDAREWVKDHQGTGAAPAGAAEEPGNTESADVCKSRPDQSGKPTERSRKSRRAVALLAVRRIGEKATGKSFTSAHWRLIARQVAGLAGHEAQKAFCKARALRLFDPPDFQKATLRAIEKAPDEDVPGIILQLIVAAYGWTGGYGDKFGEGMRDALKLYRIDLKDLEREAEAEARAKREDRGGDEEDAA